MNSRWAGIVVLLAIVIYLPVLNNGFVFDDHAIIRTNPTIQDLANIPTFFSTPLTSYEHLDKPEERSQYWRPLFLTSLAFVYRVFGANPAGYHLLSLILHGLSTLLVFFVGRAIADHEHVAAAGAAIFALHPVHVEAVAWASAIPDLLMASCALAALASYHQFRTKGLLRWGIITLVFLVFTFLSKESGITAPLVLVAYEFLLASRRGRKASLALLGSSCLLALAYLAVRHKIGLPHQLDYASLGFPIGSLRATVVLVAGHYSRLLLFPIHLVAFYPTHLINQSFLGDEVLRALFFLGALSLFLAIVIRSRKDAFLLIWMGLSLATAALSVLGQTSNLLAERYLYLPSAGFCLLLSKLIVTRPSGLRPSNRTVALLMILLGSFALRDVDRLADWRDEFTFLRVTLRDAPRAHVIQNRMANYLLGDLGDLEGAKEAYNAEVVRDPNFLNVRYSLASSLLKKGEFVEAYNSTLLLSALKPDWVPALIIAAEAAGRIGRTDYAKALLEKSLSLEPDHALVHNHMGNVAFLEGKVSEAIKWWERSAELDPSNVQVLFNLALGYEKVGENERAIAYYRRFSGKAPPEMGQTLQRARSKIEELSRKR